MTEDEKGVYAFPHKGLFSEGMWQFLQQERAVGKTIYVCGYLCKHENPERIALTYTLPFRIHVTFLTVPLLNTEYISEKVVDKWWVNGCYLFQAASDSISGGFLYIPVLKSRNVKKLMWRGISGPCMWVNCNCINCSKWRVLLDVTDFFPLL